MRYYINGRFLTRKMTGVERYATELLRAIDAILAERGTGGDEWTVLVPPGVAVDTSFLKVVETRTAGPGSGHVWEQTALARAAFDGILLNLTNSGPILHRRSFTVVHDAMVYRMPNLFSFRYRTFHAALGRALARVSRLGTVSEFSRRELADVLKLDPRRIFLVPNGAEHLGGVQPDLSTLERLGLERNKFLLFVGSPAPQKNLPRALKAFASLGETGQSFVIVGSAQASVFGKAEEPLPKGAIATGRLTDAEVAGLYASATALVFPSVYEGFGIPPLEAMSYRCPVLAADIAPVREVCGDAVRYFDPHSVEDIARSMAAAISDRASLATLADEGEGRLALFTWRRSAEALLKVITPA